MRFRRALIADGPDRRLFEAVTVQLKARAITVKTGTLVDATHIASASKEDDESRWVKHRSRGSVHVFKARFGADAETTLVEAVSVTPANVHDGREGPAALPGDPGDVFADCAYRGQHVAQAVRARAQVHFTATACNLKRSLNLQPAQRPRRESASRTPQGAGATHPAAPDTATVTPQATRARVSSVVRTSRGRSPHVVCRDRVQIPDAVGRGLGSSS